ncbi:hypothetical protein, partial [Gluconobacter kondonii]|uniref:hypothetical protein n=1 Tax=Gluconobacter kondonii TaxID=941463 RepID=UPI001B8AE3B9
LYCRSHGVRGRGAPMTYLAHKASFHSRENNTPSKHGTKQLTTPEWHTVIGSGNLEFAYRISFPTDIPSQL